MPAQALISTKGDPLTAFILYYLPIKHHSSIPKQIKNRRQWTMDGGKLPSKKDEDGRQGRVWRTTRDNGSGEIVALT